MTTWKKQRSQIGCAESGQSEQELTVRREALQALILTTGLSALLYLGLGLAGGVKSRLFPWDGIGLGVVSLGSGLVLIIAARWPARPVSEWENLQREAKLLPTVASFFLALASQPLFYASQTYGVQSPSIALFTLSILAAGLLVGLRFVGIWTLMMCAWVALAGWGQHQGWWAKDAPISLGQWISYTAFWWAVLAGAGAFAWFSARFLERSLQVAHGQATSLTRAIQALAETPDLRQVLEQMLRVMTEQLGARRGMLHLRQSDEGGLSPYLVYPPESEPLSEKLSESQRLANESLLANQNRPLLQGERLLAPLRLGEGLAGYIELEPVVGRRFLAEEIELAHTLAQQTSLALQLTKLAEQGQQAAIWQERSRLAGDIHDTLAQGFTGIILQLEAADDSLSDDPAEAANHLERARSLARSSLAEARRSVWALRPQALERASLAEALTQTVNTLTNDTALQVDVWITPELPHMPADVETDLLRITQEALTNVVRHAGATQVRIRLELQDKSLRLSVQDNGRGFIESMIDGSNSPTSAQSGWGLPGMRQRLQKYGGSFEVQNGPPSYPGILLCANWPIPFQRVT